MHPSKSADNVVADRGWRLEVAALPELTTVGGRRAHDLTERTALLPQLGSGPTDDSPGAPDLHSLSKREVVDRQNQPVDRHTTNLPELAKPVLLRVLTRAVVVDLQARLGSTPRLSTQRSCVPLLCAASKSSLRSTCPRTPGRLWSPWKHGTTTFSSRCVQPLLGSNLPDSVGRLPECFIDGT